MAFFVPLLISAAALTQPPAARSAARQPAAPHSAMRRTVLASAAALGLGAVLPALPASASQDPNDATRLVRGCKEIDALLKNWEVETTTKEGARNADIVRKVLGLRSTEDPLFQMDKLLKKSVTKADPDRLEEWIDATDSLSTHANNANEFAYTATFGEYNPGGGKDQVEKYLEMSRNELLLVSRDLRTIIGLLGLSA